MVDDWYENEFKGEIAAFNAYPRKVREALFEQHLAEDFFYAIEYKDRRQLEEDPLLQKLGITIEVNIHQLSYVADAWWKEAYKRMKIQYGIPVLPHGYRHELKNLPEFLEYKARRKRELESPGPPNVQQYKAGMRLLLAQARHMQIFLWWDCCLQNETPPDFDSQRFRREDFSILLYFLAGERELRKQFELLEPVWMPEVLGSDYGWDFFSALFLGKLEYPPVERSVPPRPHPHVPENVRAFQRAIEPTLRRAEEALLEFSRGEYVDLPRLLDVHAFHFAELLRVGPPLEEKYGILSVTPTLLPQSSFAMLYYWKRRRVKPAEKDSTEGINAADMTEVQLKEALLSGANKTFNLDRDESQWVHYEFVYRQKRLNAKHEAMKKEKTAGQLHWRALEKVVSHWFFECGARSMKKYCMSDVMLGNREVTHFYLEPMNPNYPEQHERPDYLEFVARREKELAIPDPPKVREYKERMRARFAVIQRLTDVLRENCRGKDKIYRQWCDQEEFSLLLRLLEEERELRQEYGFLEPVWMQEVLSSDYGVNFFDATFIGRLSSYGKEPESWPEIPSPEEPFQKEVAFAFRRAEEYFSECVKKLAYGKDANIPRLLDIHISCLNWLLRKCVPLEEKFQIETVTPELLPQSSFSLLYCYERWQQKNKTENPS